MTFYKNMCCMSWADTLWFGAFCLFLPLLGKSLHDSSSQRTQAKMLEGKEVVARVGVGVFVFKSRDDRRFSMGLRKGSISAGTYSLVGGHLEHNEAFIQCAKREVKEKTDLEIEGVEYLTTVESFFQGDNRHYVTIFVTAYVKGKDATTDPEPKVIEPDKCTAWTWCSFSEMRKFDESLFLPLKHLLEQRPEVCRVMENEEKKSVMAIE